jgi:hypothetical protein
MVLPCLKTPEIFIFFTRVFFGDHQQAGLSQIWLQVREGGRIF